MAIGVIISIYFFYSDLARRTYNSGLMINIGFVSALLILQVLLNAFDSSLIYPSILGQIPLPVPFLVILYYLLVFPILVTVFRVVGKLFARKKVKR
jgi:hypothetical protein